MITQALLVLVAMEPQVASPAPATPSQQAPQNPSKHLIEPGTAQAISGATLVAGLVMTTLLAKNRDWARERPLDAPLVGVATLVFAPTIGRSLGNDLERFPWRTGTRLLLAAGALLAYWDASPISTCCSSKQGFEIAVMAVTVPALFVHSIADVAGMRCDIALDRAVTALSIARTADGGVTLAVRSSF